MPGQTRNGRSLENCFGGTPMWVRIPRPPLTVGVERDGVRFAWRWAADVSDSPVPVACVSEVIGAQQVGVVIGLVQAGREVGGVDDLAETLGKVVGVGS